jgi:hypothetical protein
MNEKLKQMLYKYFDQELSPAEKIYLENELKESAELKDEKQKIESLRNLLESNEYSFNSNFSENILQSLSANKHDIDTYIINIFPKFFYGIAAAIIILIATSFMLNGTLSFDSLLGINNSMTDNLNLFMYDF